MHTSSSKIGWTCTWPVRLPEDLVITEYNLLIVVQTWSSTHVMCPSPAYRVRDAQWVILVAFTPHDRHC